MAIVHRPTIAWRVGEPICSSTSSLWNRRGQQRSARTSLSALDEAVDKKEDYRADNGADNAGRISGPIPPDRLAQIGRDERTDNSQNSGENKAPWLGFVAGHNELGDHADDKANDDGPNDRHYVAPDLNRHSGEQHTETTGARSSLT